MVEQKKHAVFLTMTDGDGVSCRLFPRKSIITYLKKKTAKCGDASDAQFYTKYCIGYSTQGVTFT